MCVCHVSNYEPVDHFHAIFYKRYDRLTTSESRTFTFPTVKNNMTETWTCEAEATLAPINF